MPKIEARECLVNVKIFSEKELAQNLEIYRDRVLTSISLSQRHQLIQSDMLNQIFHILILQCSWTKVITNLHRIFPLAPQVPQLQQVSVLPTLAALVPLDNKVHLQVRLFLTCSHTYLSNFTKVRNIYKYLMPN